MSTYPDRWRQAYGGQVRVHNGWLVGRSDRWYRWAGAGLLPLAAIVLIQLEKRSDASTLAWIAGGAFFAAALLLLGATNEVAVEFATGAVRTRRGLFGIARTHRFVRPQIDGVFMTVHEDPRNPNITYFAVGLQAGLGRWALLRTTNTERAMGFYRDLQRATGFSSVDGD